MGRAKDLRTCDRSDTFGVQLERISLLSSRLIASRLAISAECRNAMLLLMTNAALRLKIMMRAVGKSQLSK